MPRGMFHRMCHTALSFRTFFCHSERSEDGLLRTPSEKSRVHSAADTWVFPRSFTPLRSVLDDNVGEGTPLDDNVGEGTPLDDNPTGEVC